MTKHMFKAIPKLGAMDEDIDLIPLSEVAKFDGTYVYGWYVDGFIVGEVIEANNEYIAIEYWVPVDPETVCLVNKELEDDKVICD